MTNWEREVGRIKTAQQNEESLKRDIQKQEQIKSEMAIQEKIKNDYENIVIPGFKVLDSFNIRETLTEIRDQIWKVGEISKEPTNFEEYKNPQIKGIFNKKPEEMESPKYVLSVSSVDYCPEFIPDDRSEGEYIDKFRSFKKTLVIAFFNGKIFVSANKSLADIQNGYEDYDYSFLKNSNQIDTTNNPPEQIKKWIKDRLIEDCVQRRDYSKIDPEILKRPELYERYKKEILNKK